MTNPGTGFARVAPVKIVAACALLAAACDGQRPVSDGSVLRVVQTWTVDGDALGTKVVFPPAGAGNDLLSLTVVASTANSARLAFDIFDGNARILVDSMDPEGSINRALSAIQLATAMVPSASASLPLTDNYQVGARSLDVATPGGITVTAFGKSALNAGAVPAVQDLLVQLVLAGADQKDDSRVDAMLAGAEAIWSLAGVEIREAAPRSTAPTVDPDIAAHLQIDAQLGSDSPAMARLFLAVAADPSAMIPRTPPNVVPIVIVGDITLTGGGSLWALSGGIPVPPVAGTIHTGIAVSAAALQQDPGQAGRVLAHEIGHALGLYHTTEGQLMTLAGGVAATVLHDQLDDTAECPATADTNPKDGVLSATECAGYDAGNLMFWLSGGGTTISAQQGEIARRSALTH